MRENQLGTGSTLLRHLRAYVAVLALLAVLSWLGRGWGYFVLYGVVVVAFGLVVAAVSLGLRWSSRSVGAERARGFLARSLRSFTFAQLTLGAVILGTGMLARLHSGPLGPFAGGAFEGMASNEALEKGLVIGPDEEIQIQIPGDPPYTITTHAFLVAGDLYVGADFVLPFKRWVHIVKEDPGVVVRIRERLFRRRAVYLSDPDESRRILEEVSRQRGVDPRDWLTEVWFFRLDPPS